MDLTSKGISWVENMCQNLETMCVEVFQEMDNFIAQEHSKYVKNQVQTVGINVQDFYSEVLQDLLRPVDSVKGPLSDLSLIYGMDNGMLKNPTKAFEECAQADKISHADLKVPPPMKDYNLESVANVPDSINHGDVLCDTMNGNSLPSSTDAEDIEVTEEAKANQNPSLAEAAIVDELITPLSSKSKLVVPSVSNEGQLSPSARVLSCDLTGSCTSRVLVSSAASAMPLTSLPTAQTGVSNNFNQKESYDTKDISQLGADSKEEFEDIVLGESYLDVEEKEFDNEISIVCQRATMRKSYKKKLRDALLSKLRSAKKHDYRKLEVLYGNVENKANKNGYQSSATVAVTGDLKEPLNQDFSEPDWEFL